MKIPRTERGYQPKSSLSVTDPWSNETHHFAGMVYVDDYPTHSPILGPDGRPLEYEKRQPVGFRK